MSPPRSVFFNGLLARLQPAWRYTVAVEALHLVMVDVATIIRINRELERIRDGHRPLSDRFEVIQLAESALAQAAGVLDSAFLARTQLLITQVQDAETRHKKPATTWTEQTARAAQEHSLREVVRPLTPNGRYRLGEYHPYWLPGHVRNPGFDAFCGMILDLKKKPGDYQRAEAVEYFARRVRPLIPDDAMLAYVPSSDPLNLDTGVRDIARRLAGSGERDATACLVRTRRIQPLHCGGVRCEATHLESLRVETPWRIRGNNVVVLDDVTTTGVSLRVAARLFREAGANAVATLALGATSHDH